MCTHQRYVYNRFSDTSVLVKCGHCNSCLQEKAYHRSSRIKSEYSPDKLCLFVTLTYDRASCPFVLQSDVDKRLDILPIYREFSTRRVRCSLKSGLAYLDKRHYERVKLDDIYFPDYESFSRKKFIRHLKYRNNHIGVCYYPDVQLFKKRLYMNLKRIYHYEEKFKTYSCSEYGGTTMRPHFHLLFFIRPNDEKIFRSAISQAWPFASKFRTERYIEVARDAANYVASYVNCGTNLHRFLSDNFKTKHSYSKDFGMGSKLFSFDSILDKVKRRDLSYLRGVGPKGHETYVNFSIPKYVINRYFPLFKGYSRLADTEVLDVLRCFVQPTVSQNLNMILRDKLVSIDYSNDDLHTISTRLFNSYTRYCQYRSLPLGFSSREDYIHHYFDAWKVYKMTNLKLWYLDDTVDPKYKYDNTKFLVDGLINSPDTLAYLDTTPEPYIADPNDYPDNVSRSALNERIFAFRTKEKNINNFVMAQNNYYF